jgi:hypothetical protein
MKHTFTVLGVGFVLLVAGCRSAGWDITLNNGTRITGVSRPKLDRARGIYVFKDAGGKADFVQEMRVRVIEPHVEEQQREYGLFKDGKKQKQK